MRSNNKIKTLKLTEYKNKDLIESIAFLLDEAIAGKIQGAVIAASRGPFHHDMLTLGSYNNDPYSAHRVIDKLKEIIEIKAKALEEHAIIEHQF